MPQRRVFTESSKREAVDRVATVGPAAVAVEPATLVGINNKNTVSIRTRR